MAKGRGQKVNRTGLSEIFGVALPTIDSWVRAGCPFDVRGSGKGKPWVFDTSDVARWRETKAREEASGTTVVEESELKRRKLLAETLAAEHDLLVKKRLLAPLDQVERNLSRVFAEVRTNMRALPGRVVSQLIGEHDERKFKAVLLAEVDAALESLASLDITADDSDAEGANDGEDE